MVCGLQARWWRVPVSLRPPHGMEEALDSRDIPSNQSEYLGRFNDMLSYVCMLGRIYSPY